MINYYTILELENFASTDEIKTAHRRLSRLYHPDLNPAGAEQFREIQHAYEQLRDPEDKERYDEQLFEYLSESDPEDTSTSEREEFKGYTSTYYSYTPTENPGKKMRVLFFPVASAIVLFLFLLRAGYNSSLEGKVNTRRVTNEQPLVLPQVFSGKTFKIGDNQYIVKDAQGMPTDILKYQDEETWYYQNSTVTFKNGLVSRYNNADKNLNIAL